MLFTVQKIGEDKYKISVGNERYEGSKNHIKTLINILVNLNLCDRIEEMKDSDFSVFVEVREFKEVKE